MFSFCMLRTASLSLTDRVFHVNEIGCNNPKKGITAPAILGLVKASGKRKVHMAKVPRLMMDSCYGRLVCFYDRPHPDSGLSDSTGSVKRWPAVLTIVVGTIFISLNVRIKKFMKFQLYKGFIDYPQYDDKVVQRLL